MTNPERFAPIVPAVLDLLDELNREFDVDRVVDFGIDTELERDNATLPTWKLTPRSSVAASITVAFTSFPGVRYRCGRWHRDGAPSCGCDACAETASENIERVRELFGHVVSGHFREALEHEGNELWHVTEFGAQEMRSTSRGLVLPQHVAAMMAGDDRMEYQWQPWSKK